MTRAAAGPPEAAVLPADQHVHTQWSWDAAAGDMERTCARAVQLGLPAVAFTEHVDHTAWRVATADLDALPRLRALARPDPPDAPSDPHADAVVVPPPLDVEGYLASVERCRDRFPQLRVVTGVELGEPHVHREQVDRLLAGGAFERVLGSLHSLPVPGLGAHSEPPDQFLRRPAADVVRAYLAEVERMVAADVPFAVLAHVDYPLRSWPAAAGPLRVEDFEDAFRSALRAVAASGRAMEVNTAHGARPQLVRWWREAGGDAVTFGSDAHEPAALARGFADAAALAEAAGYRPGRHPHDLWRR